MADQIHPSWTHIQPGDTAIINGSPEKELQSALTNLWENPYKRNSFRAGYR